MKKNDHSRNKTPVDLKALDDIDLLGLRSAVDREASPDFSQNRANLA